MRNFLILLLISTCLLSVGCSNAEESVYLTPVTEATISAYGTIGAPVTNRLDAVIVAKIWMQASRYVSVGEPQVVYAEKINLAEANQKIGWIPSAAGSEPEGTKVWLVIFEGEWQLMFPIPDEQGIIPTLEPPSHGCEFSLFTADDGGAIAGGGITCPSETK